MIISQRWERGGGADRQTDTHVGTQTVMKTETERGKSTEKDRGSSETNIPTVARVRDRERDREVRQTDRYIERQKGSRAGKQTGRQRQQETNTDTGRQRQRTILDQYFSGLGTETHTFRDRTNIIPPCASPFGPRG